MKLFKKLFVFLTVLVLMLTVTACTVDESELNNLLNGLLTSNNSANVTTSSTLPVSPSTSTSSNYGVDSSSEPYYPINPTESTNSSIYLVPPSPPVEILPEYSASQESSSSKTTVTPPTYQTNGLYSFEATLAPYEKGYVFEEKTNIKPFTVSQGIKTTTSSGKTAKDGSAIGYMFTYGFQLGKNGSFDNKSLQITTTGYQQIEIYASGSSTGVISGELRVIDYQGYVIDSAIILYGTVHSYVLTMPSEGTYALVATMESSITVWGVSFIENA